INYDQVLLSEFKTFDAWVFFRRRGFNASSTCAAKTWHPRTDLTDDLRPIDAHLSQRSFTCVVSQPKCLCIISSSIRARKKNFSATHRKSILCLSDEDDGRVLAVGGCGRRRLGRWRACRGGRRGGGARSGWDSVRGDGRGRCRSRRQ